MTKNESLEGALPESIQAGLNRFSERMQNALGEKLICIVLYGEAVEGEFKPEKSDLNIMVVLEKVTVELLDEAALPVQVAHQEMALSVLLLSEDDLRHSTDVFPIKFLSIQRAHQLLYGKDVLTDLQISRDHLRLRCEQEIKNLMLRLNQFYLEQNLNPERIEKTLIRVISPFVKDLGVLVELKTGKQTSTIDAIVSSAAEIGIDVKSLKEILAVKRGASEPNPDELKHLYNSFMQTVHQAAAIVDLA